MARNEGATLQRRHLWVFMLHYHLHAGLAETPANRLYQLHEACTYPALQHRAIDMYTKQPPGLLCVPHEQHAPAGSPYGSPHMEETPPAVTLDHCLPPPPRPGTVCACQGVLSVADSEACSRR